MLKYIEKVPPNNIAVVFHDKDNYEISYGELLNSVINIIDELKGYNFQQQVVGICMSRSICFLCTVCACLHLQIPFLVISPQLPEFRRAFMIRESGVSLLITEQKDNENNNCSITIENINNKSICFTDEISYILYTSGSTGVPKGVLISRNNLECFLNSIIDEIPFSKYKTCLACSDFSFDISLVELLVPLMLGMTIHMTSDRYLKNPHALSFLLKDNHIDVVQLTPSFIRMLFMFNKKNLSFMIGIKMLLVGGEPFPVELRKEILNIIPDVYNMYGPTEATIWCSYMKIKRQGEITIGRPFKGLHFSIRDIDGVEVKNGVKGELWVEGKQVAVGYVKPQIDEKRFIRTSEQHFYKTGDLCIKNNDGNYVYLGRIDNQVKFRGYRIELEEIEKTVLLDSRIEQVVVQMKNQQLVCYYMSNEYTPEFEKDIFVMLKTRLPSYMIPSKFQRVSGFKIKNNGKIDRKQLELNEG